MKRGFLTLLFVLTLALLVLVSCVDTTTESSTEVSQEVTSKTDDTAQSEDTGEGDTTDTTGTTATTGTIATSGTEGEGGEDTNDTQKYFVATVKQNNNTVCAPYTADKVVPEGLEGVYYSATEAGGKPQGNGNGKIWIQVTPQKAYGVSRLSVSGVYTYVENVTGDIYCIHGVGSDLSVTVHTASLPTTSERVIEGVGYTVSDSGYLSVNWSVATEGVRYVELTYIKNGQEEIEYLDFQDGNTIFAKLKENEKLSFSLRGVGYSSVGKRFSFDACYMTAPKETAFPRVEISTQGGALPTFDVVNSPDGCWGQGITNASYEQCVVTIYDENNGVVYTSSQSIDDYLGAKIKVRGNTSASQAPNQKYPYKIKLSDRADLLGGLIDRYDTTKSYEDKNWLLLSYGDQGYRIAGDAVADALGTAWSPDYCYVALYVNGDYRGLYVLSEAVSVGKTSGESQWRVPVDDDGYLIECDAYWWNEDLYFNTPVTEDSAMYFTFKEPDPDKITEDSDEYKYIKDYMIRFEEALLKNDDSYLDYIDLDSFVKWLLVSDYLSISDGGGCNIFLYKKDATDSSKLFLGPNWDFDSWQGGVESLSTIRVFWNECPFYIPYLLRHESFVKRYKELYNQTKDILDEYIESAFALTEGAAHDKLLEYETTRFGTRSTSLTQVENNFKNWLDRHIAWMDTQFGY